MAAPTNIIDLKEFKDELSINCSLWIEIDESTEVICYFVRHDITLEYRFLYDEVYNSRGPIYTNYWELPENLDYVY